MTETDEKIDKMVKDFFEAFSREIEKKRNLLNCLFIEIPKRIKKGVKKW